MQVFVPECLTCGYLVTGATKERPIPQCHYSKGNTHCPAAEVKIVVAGKAFLYAEKVAAARQERNIRNEVRYLNLVKKESPQFQSIFFDHLNKL